MLSYLGQTNTARKPKPKTTAQLKLTSVKCWTDSDPDAPQFAEMDDFEIVKFLVLKVGILLLLFFCLCGKLLYIL